MNDSEYAYWKGTAGPGAQLREMLKQEKETKQMVADAKMDIGKKQIDKDVLKVIRDGDWVEDGLGFVLPPVDHAMYQKCAKVLKACGGTWNRKAKATIFEDEDAVQSLMEAAITGVYVDTKKAYQQFDTPDSLADEMVERLLDGPHEMTLTFLEPSAGTGQLIRAVARCCNDEDLEDAEVIAVEADPARATKLRENLTGSTSQVCKLVETNDFLRCIPDELGKFDRVVMNPPFTKSQDIDHVMHAWKFLKPGGRLAAIVSPGFTFRQDNKAKAFREFVEQHGGVGWDAGWDKGYYEVPEGTFKAAGTNVRTIMIVLDKH